MIDGDTFRDVLGAWASGVAVVACRTERRVVATTVSSFMSLSLEPPLILVAIGPNATVRPFLQPGQPFGVSVLTAGQRRLAMTFADPYPVGPDPFRAEGDPLIPHCLLGLSCVVERVDAGGDHAMVIAAVHEVQDGRYGGAPLVRFNRKYHALGE